MIAGYAENARPLTPRMRDVLLCAANGLTAADTARRLHVSEPTVWNVRAAVCARLGVASIVAAVHAAHRAGELR